MKPEEIAAHLARRLPGPASAGSPVPLTGGLLNLLWRVEVDGGSVVVKHAPPFVASAPEIPLDPARLGFEARALSALSPGGSLAAVSVDDARPPRLLDFDPEAAVLVMEDLGPLPHLGEALAAGRPAEGPAAALGRFIGTLHATTLGDSVLAAAFDNRPVQQTRHQVQYLPVGNLLAAAGVPDAAVLGARVAELGERLQSPGRCLIMGDLWPSSVLLDGDRVRVIDWELCHFGQPAQDLGHLEAHLWMLHHRAPNPDAAAAAEAAWRRFVRGYDEGAGARREHLLDEATQRDRDLHAAAEILVRTLGPFRGGFLYHDLPPSSTAVAEAVAEAARRLRHPGAGAD